MEFLVFTECLLGGEVGLSVGRSDGFMKNFVLNGDYICAIEIMDICGGWRICWISSRVYLDPRKEIRVNLAIIIEIEVPACFSFHSLYDIQSIVLVGNIQLLGEFYVNSLP